MGFSMSDGIVPGWGGILKDWADYCAVAVVGCMLSLVV